MKSLYRSLAGLLLLILSFPAMAGRCPLEMNKIDAALAASPSLSNAQLSRVMELRASGEKKHKSGKHRDSVKDLAEAKKLLGL